MKRIWLKMGMWVFWCSWPALWIYLHHTERTRLLIMSGGEFLVLRGWLSAGNWILPGGGLHEGEEPMAGLVREVKEETGLTFAKEQMNFLFHGTYNEYGFNFTYSCYTLELPEKPEIRTQRWEIVDYDWRPIKSPGIRLAQDGREALNRWLSEE